MIRRRRPTPATPIAIDPTLLRTPTILRDVPCDGRPLDAGQYPELADALHGLFGDAGPGTVRVPLMPLCTIRTDGRYLPVGTILRRLSWDPAQ